MHASTMIVQLPRIPPPITFGLIPPQLRHSIFIWWNVQRQWFRGKHKGSGSCMRLTVSLTKDTTIQVCTSRTVCLLRFPNTWLPVAWWKLSTNTETAACYSAYSRFSTSENPHLQRKVHCCMAAWYNMNRNGHLTRQTWILMIVFFASGAGFDGGGCLN